MLTRRSVLVGTALAVPALMTQNISMAAAATSATGKKPDLSKMPRRKVKLVPPPFAHDHEQATSKEPVIVEFEMTIIEKEVEIDGDGTMMQGMTFEGSIPGPLMVVHEGDYVELTLINPPENSMPHNIDFHAATGGLGGGALTLINPGEKTVLRFKATHPGTFVYHCAPGGPMIPWHVVSGMSGTIMILPRDGLKDHAGKPVKYDKVFYIGENDFYIPRDKDGAFKRFKDHGSAYAETLDVMNGLIPSHVVFNGKAGALTGDNALESSVGETVLFIHSQANRDTRPHLIGELEETPILEHARMQEVLVNRRQLILENDIQLFDDLLVALHDRLHVLFCAP